MRKTTYQNSKGRWVLNELERAFPNIVWKERLEGKGRDTTWAIVAPHFEVRELGQGKKKRYICHISHDPWKRGHTEKIMSETIPNGDTPTNAVKAAIQYIEDTISVWSGIIKSNSKEPSQSSSMMKIPSMAGGR